MTPKQLLAEVSAGKFRPIYYFYGTEDYRIVEAEKYIAHQFLPDRQIVVNYHRVNGSKTGCADLVAELSVYPMLGERQVIAVTNFQRYKPKEIDRLRKVLDPPDTNRVVVFSSPGAKAPKESSAFFKKVAGFAQQVKFGRLDRRDCVATIVRGLAGAGLDIEPEARDMLVELVAGNRGAIETEVAKLIDFVEPGQTVSTDDVRSVAAGFQVYTVFGLMDEIVRGDRIAALRSLKRLLTEGTSATGMLYIIGQHIISLYLVKHGKPIEPYRRWLVPRFRDQAARFGSRQLERMIVKVAESDSVLRRQTPRPSQILEELVLLMTESPDQTTIQR